MRSASSFERFIPGVVFAEDFDEAPASDRDPVRADAGPPAAPAAAIEATIEAVAVAVPEIDVARLVSEARDEGFAAGVRTVEAGLDSQRTALLASLHQQFANLSGEAASLIDRRMETIAKAAMSIVLSCVPSIAGRFADDELRLALQHVLPRLTDEVHVAIAVHPSQETLARSTVSAAFGSELGPGVRVTIGSAAALAPGDVRVTWQDGSAVRDLADSLAQLRARLRALDLLATADEECNDVERR